MWKESGKGTLRPKNRINLHFEAEVCRRLKTEKKYVFSLDPPLGKLGVMSDSAVEESDSSLKKGASSIVESGSQAVWQASGPPFAHSPR